MSSGKSSGFQGKHFRGRIPPDRRGPVRAAPCRSSPAPSLPWMLYLHWIALPSTAPGPRHSRLKGTSSKVHFPITGAEDGSLPPRVYFPSSLITMESFPGLLRKRATPAEHRVGHGKNSLSLQETKCQLKPCSVFKPTTSTLVPPSPHTVEKGCPGIKLRWWLREGEVGLLCDPKDKPHC